MFIFCYLCAFEEKYAQLCGNATEAGKALDETGSVSGLIFRFILSHSLKIQFQT
jgi:hypothetical protein